MTDLELTAIIVISALLGASIGHAIGYHRAKRLSKFDVMDDSSVLLMDYPENEKPRLQCHGYYWTGTYRGWEALGNTAEDVIRSLYQEHAKSRMWKW